MSRSAQHACRTQALCSMRCRLVAKADCVAMAGRPRTWWSLARERQPLQDLHQNCAPRQLPAVFPKVVQHSPGSFPEPFLPRPFTWTSCAKGPGQEPAIFCPCTGAVRECSKGSSHTAWTHLAAALTTLPLAVAETASRCAECCASQQAPSMQSSPACSVQVIDTFKVAAELGSESLGAYVISMAHTASDVLAVELLKREACHLVSGVGRGHAPASQLPSAGPGNPFGVGQIVERAPMPRPRAEARGAGEEGGSPGHERGGAGPGGGGAPAPGTPPARTHSSSLPPIHRTGSSSLSSHEHLAGRQVGHCTSTQCGFGHMLGLHVQSPSWLCSARLHGSTPAPDPQPWANMEGCRSSIRGGHVSLPAPTLQSAAQPQGRLRSSSLLVHLHTVMSLSRCFSTDPTAS